MKLLVFSDTPNSPSRLLDVAGREKGVTALFHLGDGPHDADLLADLYPAIPLYRVRGNCDYASFDPDEGITPFGGVLFYYTHGHLLGVKQDLWQLARRAKKAGAQVALFGHTHLPLCESREGIQLFNPGSLNVPRSGRGSYGVITLQEGKPSFEVLEY